MISLNSRDHENELVSSFSSDILSPLLTSHNVDPNQLFPAVGEITHDWNADGLITRFQNLYNVVTPRETVLPGTMVQKPEQSLNDEEKAIIRTETVRHFSMNDQSYVEFTAPIVEVAPAPPEGYGDLATLLAFLKEARNAGLQLETVSL